MYLFSRFIFKDKINKIFINVLIMFINFKNNLIFWLEPFSKRRLLYKKTDSEYEKIEKINLSYVINSL
jgi:hypothetical protein